MCNINKTLHKCASVTVLPSVYCFRCIVLECVMLQAVFDTLLLCVMLQTVTDTLSLGVLCYRLLLTHCHWVCYVTDCY